MPDEATDAAADDSAQKPAPKKRAKKAGKGAPQKKDEGNAGDADGGKLTFDPSIITQIAITEAQKIEGIVQLTGSFMDDWVLRRGKGVSVEQIDEAGQEAYSLDLKISVEYGVDCVKLAAKVRENIAKAIKRMTGRDTKTINVHVTGIGHKEEHHAEPHDDEPVPEGTGIDF